MRYACEYITPDKDTTACNKLLAKGQLVTITVSNSYYEKERISVCPEHAEMMIPWRTFSWAKEPTTKGIYYGPTPKAEPDS